MKTTPARIALAVDGSNNSMKAAEYALELGKKIDAELVAVHVVDLSSVFKMLPQATKKELIKIGRPDAKKIFEQVACLAGQRDINIKTEVIESSCSAADALIRYAKARKIDLIVVGTKGRSGMKKVLLGSVASKVVTHAPCAVLVIP